MERPKMRNEFGLDRYNEADVQNERRGEYLPWIFAGLGIFMLFAGIAFYTSTPADAPAVADRPAPTTTGSGSQLPQR